MGTSDRKRYVLAYDVTEDGTRTQLANMLLDYGQRVQKSVFEADISAEDLKEILKRASNLLAPTDSLLVYPLCQSCANRIRSIGVRVETRPVKFRLI